MTLLQRVACPGPDQTVMATTRALLGAPHIIWPSRFVRLMRKQGEKKISQRHQVRQTDFTQGGDSRAHPHGMQHVGDVKSVCVSSSPPKASTRDGPASRLISAVAGKASRRQQCHRHTLHNWFQKRMATYCQRRHWIFRGKQNKPKHARRVQPFAQHGPDSGQHAQCHHRTRDKTGAKSEEFSSHPHLQFLINRLSRSQLLFRSTLFAIQIEIGQFSNQPLPRRF